MFRTLRILPRTPLSIPRRQFHSLPVLAMSSSAATSLTVPSNSPFLTSPASHDFRSDTLTTPTLHQLSSLLTLSNLGDDVFHESTTTNSLQSHLATIFAKPAALFVSSGTAGNQLALGSLLALSTGAPHSILADWNSHIFQYEAGGTSTLWGAQITPVKPSNGLWLTLEDVKREVLPNDDEHYAPTKVVCLENTINGVVQPIEEMKRIVEWVKGKGMKVHIDGARLWNAAVAIGRKDGRMVGEVLKELAGLGDTVSVCLSKGIGAPMGSILVGDEKVIEKARRLRKMMGGGQRQVAVVSGMARAAIEEVWEFEDAERIKRTHRLAERLGKTWRELGGELDLPVESNMVWLKFQGEWEARWVEEVKKVGLEILCNRIVVHWQIAEDAVDAMETAMKVVRKAMETEGVGMVGDKEKKSMYEKK